MTIVPATFKTTTITIMASDPNHASIATTSLIAIVVTSYSKGTAAEDQHKCSYTKTSKRLHGSLPETQQVSAS